MSIHESRGSRREGEESLSDLTISWRIPSTPLALLLLTFVSFGLLIPWLGFYWDDWPIIYLAQLGEPSQFWEFYRYDRPFSAWTYLLTVPLLGTSPVLWHLFTLLVRWLAVVGMWWGLRGLWPGRERCVAWIALLFAVYPAFTQQPIAVAYSQHWISYGLYVLSIGSTIYAWRSPRWFWPLTITALSASALHLFTMEYFIGLEPLRPVFLWVLASEKMDDIRSRIAVVFKRWLPYVLILLVFIVWRFFILDLAGEDPNQLILIANLLDQPLSTLVQFSNMIVQDTLHVLIASWYPTLQPREIEFRGVVLLLSYILAAITTTAMAVYFRFTSSTRESEETHQGSWLKQAVAVGLLAIVLGTLPSWLLNRQIIFGLYSNRFALPAMLGASILIVAFIEWFASRRAPKILLLSLLIGLAAGFHLRNANEYRWIWEMQSRYYRQLFWRAPYLQPNTAILSENELFPLVGTYSTSIATNLLYSQIRLPSDTAYWFYDMHDSFGRDLVWLRESPYLNYNFRSFNFTGSNGDSLVIYYTPEEGRCLWVLSLSDADNPELPQLTRDALSFSNLSRIETDPDPSIAPPSSIFGPEPSQTWCYFYQKAELARQKGDWQAIVQLGDQAQSQRYAPNNRLEWLPFIKAYAYNGKWEQAEELSLRAFTTEHLEQYGCKFWDDLEANMPPSPERDASSTTVRAVLGCQQFP